MESEFCNWAGSGPRFIRRGLKTSSFAIMLNLLLSFGYVHCFECMFHSIALEAKMHPTSFYSSTTGRKVGIKAVLTIQSISSWKKTAWYLLIESSCFVGKCLRIVLSPKVHPTSFYSKCRKVGIKDVSIQSISNWKKNLPLLGNVCVRKMVCSPTPFPLNS